MRRGAPVGALAAAACAAALAVALPPGGSSDAVEGREGVAEMLPAGMEPEEDSVRARGAEGDRPAAAARATGGAAAAVTEAARRSWPGVAWRDSTAVGVPEAGRLVRGVRLPPEGRHFFSWDPVERESPNRPWRRWGADYAVRATLRVIADHRRAFPRAPRVGIGDLSRPHGGDFGIAYGPIGHASHQNGLDVDVPYPLRSRDERAPLSVDEVDLRLSQDLVDRFVAAGAEKVFVGPSTPLTGPPEVVQAIPNHDNHIHARFPPEP